MPADTHHERVVALPADVDLHARPAAAFVRATMSYDARVTVVVGEREADAKSLLAVLALGARRGTSLLLRADGPEAEKAVAGLAELVSGLAEAEAA